MVPLLYEHTGRLIQDVDMMCPNNDGGCPNHLPDGQNLTHHILFFFYSFFLLTLYILIC